jgi:hypothetical protein
MMLELERAAGAAPVGVGALAACRSSWGQRCCASRGRGLDRSPLQLGPGARPLATRGLALTSGGGWDWSLGLGGDGGRIELCDLGVLVGHRLEGWVKNM